MHSTYLKDRKWYEDLYDRLTVEHARSDTKYFMQVYDKWFEVMPDEKPESLRSSFHLNHIYMLFVGNNLLNRYDNRDARIADMIAKDEAKDEQIATARLAHEPVCKHCGKVGLRIISKDLMHREDNAKWDDPEEVLFMLKCLHCSKNSAYWEDGSPWEHHKTHCPKCKAAMTGKDTRRGQVITTTYKCPKCGHAYKSKLDLATKTDEEKPDPDFEKDKYTFCLRDKEFHDQLRDAKYRYEGLAQMFKEDEERKKNKHVYDAISKLKKPRVAELIPLLAKPLEKADYIEFRLDKPEMGRDVYVGFSCLDGKSEREEYNSRTTLKKIVDTALKNTNWRLMSDGITYRLGYLSGRLRAYEQEEDLKRLVTRPKPKTEA